MNGYEKSTYSQLPEPGTPTYTEAWALIEAARRMAIALEISMKDGDLKSRNELRGALQTNWRLWTIFQAELTLENSDVPADIRTNMLTLCKFVDNQSVETMREPTPEKVAALIDINRNIASGLLDAINEGENSEATQPSEQAAPQPPQPASPPSPEPESQNAKQDEDAKPAPLSLDV